MAVDDVSAAAGEPFAVTEREPAVRGVLHRAASGEDALALTHGAGGDCRTPLLVAVATTLAERGVTVLRCDLPYRQARRRGPPSPAGAARDRDGLRHALQALRPLVRGRLFLGGHSYGGRQATMLLAESPELADGLLLQSYPLHPPGRPRELRTAHLPRLRTPALFVHGAADPFGAPSELQAALALIPAPTRLVLLDGAGHSLLAAGVKPAEAGARIADEFLAWADSLAPPLL